RAGRHQRQAQKWDSAGRGHRGRSLPGLALERVGQVALDGRITGRQALEKADHPHARKANTDRPVDLEPTLRLDWFSSKICSLVAEKGPQDAAAVVPGPGESAAEEGRHERAAGNGHAQPEALGSGGGKGRHGRKKRSTSGTGK